MKTIGLRRTFDSAHRLPRHTGKCHNLHGHTYIVEVTVTGEVCVDGGMILDFYLLGKAFEQVLSRYDHATVLASFDPLVKLLQDGAADCCILIMEREPTVENMIDQLGSELSLALEGQGVKLCTIRIYETPNCWAEKTFTRENE